MKKIIFIIFLVPIISTVLFSTENPASFNVTGMDWRDNLRMEADLEILKVDDDFPEQFSAVNIENALWLLKGELQNRGYPEAKFHIIAHQNDKKVFSTTWDGINYTKGIPHELMADQVTIKIDSGVLYFFKSLEFEGIPENYPKNLKEFFHTTGVLFVSKEDKFYTESRLEQGHLSLERSLQQEGWRKAKVRIANTDINKETGAAHITVSVEAGRRYYIQQYKAVLDGEVLHQHTYEDQVYSKEWRDEKRQQERLKYLTEGFPEVEVDFESTQEFEQDGKALVNIQAAIDKGPRVQVGTITIKGDETTDKSVLMRQIELNEGDWLNPKLAQESQSGLMRMGIYEQVSMDYLYTQKDQWDLLFEVEPKDQIEVALIFGVGTYEIIRGGFELIHRNQLGRAHAGRLEAVQSMRSAHVDYRYTIPELFGENLRTYTDISYLSREEVTFDRQEFQATLGTDTYISAIHSQFAIEYNYGFFRTRNREVLTEEGLDDARVASLKFIMQNNTVDNALYPQKGRQLYASYEIANPMLGGEVAYQRVETGFNWHYPVMEDGLTFHSRIKHGFIWSGDKSSENIPFSKRFFPGGENTVRGYRNGEASPLNRFNQQIGAQSYLLLNAQISQRISKNITLNVFSDTVGFAEEFAKYPFNDWLYSVGLGTSIHTPLGPLRFEYGHNINPRSVDPQGTFHVSLGFPF